MSYNKFARNVSSHEEWKIVDRFDSTYWSGLDAQVYFDNVLLNETIQINYVVSEQIRPYYGYASYTAQRIHHGARIIQGEITMNYKRDGYLFSLLNYIRMNNDADPLLPIPSAPGDGSPIKYSNETYGPALWEQIKDEGLSGKVVNEIVSKSKKQTIDEATINRQVPVVLKNFGMFETRTEGFDINIIFGANLDSAKALRWLDDDNYDISAAYQGDSWIIQEPQGVVASTGIKLIGVSLAGVAKNVVDDGRPLLETYSFQAKDVMILKNIDSAAKTSSRSNVNSEHNLKPPVNTDKSKYNSNNAGRIGRTEVPKDGIEWEY